uniref:Uncharacterized protein n=1 Tax=Lepeophtheirus salmonis TaxID=72036 RepID=A0A0K2U625_LEPSM
MELGFLTPSLLFPFWDSLEPCFSNVVWALTAIVKR